MMMGNFELHKGATRFVFLLRRVAVKIPCFYSWEIFLNGVLANIQERRFWREMKHPMLARVIYGDPLGLCVVMERADETFSDAGVPINDRRVLNLFFARCVKACLPVDKHFSNIGRFGNKLKLIDYGD